MDDSHRILRENEELLQRCLAAEEKMRQMQSSLEERERAQKELQRLNAENAIFASQVEKLNVDIHQKNRQIDELFKKWEGSNLNVLMAENRQHAAKIEAYEGRNAELEAKIARLETELLKRAHADTELKLEVQDKSAALTLLKSELEHLRQGKASLQFELEQSCAMVRELEEKYRAIRQQETENFKKSFDILAAEFKHDKETLQSQVQKLDELNRRRDQEIQELNQNLRAAAADFDSGRKSAHERLARLESAAREKETRAQDLERRLGAMKAHEEEAAQRQKEAQDLRAALDKSRAQGRAIEEQLQALKASTQKQYEDLVREKSAAESELKQAKVSIGDKDATIEALEKQVKDLGDEKRLAEERAGKAEAAEYPGKTDEAEEPEQKKPAADRFPEPIAEPLSPPTRAEQPESGASSAKTILLAEPNQETGMLMQYVLHKEGYVVLRARTGAEVMEQLSQGGPDLILMNFALGDMDGYTLWQELLKREGTRDVPIILMVSSAASMEIFQQEGQAQVKSFLQKPFSTHELVSAVQLLLFSAKM